MVWRARRRNNYLLLLVSFTVQLLHLRGDTLSLFRIRMTSVHHIVYTHSIFQSKALLNTYDHLIRLFAS